MKIDIVVFYKKQMGKSNKEIAVKFEWLEYMGSFSATVLRLLHIVTYRYTGSMLPFLYILKVIVPTIDYLLPLDMRNRTPE